MNTEKFLPTLTDLGLLPSSYPTNFHNTTETPLPLEVSTNPGRVRNSILLPPLQNYVSEENEHSRTFAFPRTRVVLNAEVLFEPIKVQVCQEAVFRSLEVNSQDVRSENNPLSSVSQTHTTCSVEQEAEAVAAPIKAPQKIRNTAVLSRKNDGGNEQQTQDTAITAVLPIQKIQKAVKTASLGSDSKKKFILKHVEFNKNGYMNTQRKKYHRWTPEQTKKLYNLYKQGKTAEEIKKVLTDTFPGIDFEEKSIMSKGSREDLAILKQSYNRKNDEKDGTFVSK